MSIYIAKTDDDSVILAELVLLDDFMYHDLPPHPYNVRIYGGDVWSTKDHMYRAGQFYFMSSDLPRYVGITLSAMDRRDLMMKKPRELLYFHTTDQSNL